MEHWARFVAIHVGGGPKRRPLLRPRTLAKLHTPLYEGDYAGGWRIVERSWSKGPVLTHSGSNNMNFAVAWLAPQERFAVLVASNQASDEGVSAKACDVAASTLIKRYLLKKP